MQAVHATDFGAPDVLKLVDLVDPTPGPGEISIDVTHSAVGLIDVLFRQGAFKDAPGAAVPPFVPGLEVAGTVRELGEGVTGFRIGESVVSLSRGGRGGYASVFIASAPVVVSIEGLGIDPALAVSVLPNAAMAHVALSHVAHLVSGESVLIHGALGGFPAAFPGIARQLGAAKVVGTVRTSKLEAAAATQLPYDRIVDSGDLETALENEKFDVIIDAVGGTLRTHSLGRLRPGGRLIACGNASADWNHHIDSSQLWLGSIAILGFNSGAYFPAHPELIGPALLAGRDAVAAGLENAEVEVLPLSQAVVAHERMESRSVNGRIVLAPRL